MKENPIELKLRQDMTESLLGGDTRPLSEIIESDLAELSAAGLTQRQLAEAMRALTEKGLARQGIETRAGDHTVLVEEYMGRIGCPFKHAVREAKRNTTVTDGKGKTLRWSDLSIHLIEAHGFFQGLGSPYRLEPLELAAFLGLI